MSETLPAQVRAHHPFSPSTLQARESCPHYTPSSGDSAASLAGTRQHDAVENESDSDFLADNEAMAVAQCLAYADDVTKKYPGGTVLKEHYLTIDDEDTTAGYPDYVVVSADGTVAEIIDWKMGQHAVEPAENNLQGLAYLLGVKRKFPKLREATVHFVMPHRDEVDLHTFKVTPEFVDATHLRIKVIVARAKQAQSLTDFSMARPSASACLFCSLAGRCTKVTEVALNIGKKFSPLQIPETLSPNVINDASDAAIGLKLAQVVTAWATGYRARVTEKATTDLDFCPVGYRLISMQRRTVTDATKIVELAKRLLPPDKQGEVEKLLDIPLGKVEDLVKIVAPRGKKTAAVEAFGEELEKSGAVKLGNPFTVLRLDTGAK